MLIGPGIFSLTFAYFISPAHFLPGAPWYLASLLVLISFAVAWAVARDKTNSAGTTPATSATMNGTLSAAKAE